MKMVKIFFFINITVLFLSNFSLVFAQNNIPSYMKDRGTGIPTSMFGTYINKGEFIVYPFYEYYHDEDAEYKPIDFGYGLDQDFKGRYRAHEGLLFLGYGITEKLAVEFEASVITAKQFKSDNDPTDMPKVVKESGIGDVESQLR